MSEPVELRSSDADRERVADRLRNAAGEGRLTVEELDERIERAYAARTAGDLAPLTADLPQGSGLVEHRSESGDRRWLISIMGGGQLQGRWRAGPKLTSIGIMGGADVDLRNAVLTEGELTITAVTVMGGVDVIVPPGVDVELSGFALMGGNRADVPPQDLPPGARRVRVRAFSLMGGVGVRMKRRDRKALSPPAPRPPAPPRPSA